MKILFVANVAKEHINKFHIPTIKEFKIPYPNERTILEEIVNKLNNISRINKTSDKIEKEEKEILLEYNIIL